MLRFHRACGGIFFLGCIATQANAAIICVRAGNDPHETKQEIVIDEDKGAFSYVAYDGQREVLELQCDIFSNGQDQAVLCARIFSRTEGVTVEHYLIPKLSAMTSLHVSTFVQNSSSNFDPGPHYGQYKQMMMFCE